MISPQGQQHKLVTEWRALTYFNFYRLAWAALFVVLFLLGPSPSLLGSHNPELFLTCAIF